jgi:hypothetical protein
LELREYKLGNDRNIFRYSFKITAKHTPIYQKKLDIRANIALHSSVNKNNDRNSDRTTDKKKKA